MNSLSITTVLTGAILLGWHVWLCLFPKKAGAWLAGFPRHKWAGRVLTAIAIGWILGLVGHAEIAWLERSRLMFYALAPLAYILIIIFAEELLAPRALGGIFLLAPAQILDAAFLSPCRSRLVMTVFAYLLVVLGMALVWSPYIFRKMVAPLVARPQIGRILGIIGSALGFGMILLGWLVYR